MPARRACNGVLRYVLENGAKGAEIIISGKLRGSRAKAVKFKDGYMIKSGDAAKNGYIDSATRNCELKQGIIGIKVKIMLPYDPTGRNGCSTKQADVVKVYEPKEALPLVMPPKTGYAQNFNVEPTPREAAMADAPGQQ